MKKPLLPFFILFSCSIIIGCEKEKPQDSVTDIDGNSYKTIQIGEQEWMAQNLATTHYNDGTDIPLVTNNGKWDSLFTPAYCWYDNDKAMHKNTFGALYNWYAVDAGKLCPSGWHLPKDEEWKVLENYLIYNGYNYDGSASGNKIGKSLAATMEWELSFNTGDIGNDQQGNNSTGFSALPSGLRHYYGVFSFAESSGYWWTSSDTLATSAMAWSLSYHRSSLERYNFPKRNGLSVRCIRD